MLFIYNEYNTIQIFSLLNYTIITQLKNTQAYFLSILRYFVIKLIKLKFLQSYVDDFLII